MPALSARVAVMVTARGTGRWRVVMSAGRESAGVPQAVHDAADARLIIPMQEDLRSLNVATACAMAAGEALRQTGQFPGR